MSTRHAKRGCDAHKANGNLVVHGSLRCPAHPNKVTESQPQEASASRGAARSQGERVLRSGSEAARTTIRHTACDRATRGEGLLLREHERQQKNDASTEEAVGNGERPRRGSLQRAKHRAEMISDAGTLGSESFGWVRCSERAPERPADERACTCGGGDGRGGAAERTSAPEGCTKTASSSDSSSRRPRIGLPPSPRPCGRSSAMIVSACDKRQATSDKRQCLITITSSQHGGRNSASAMRS
jgi:hypothetical protein